MGQTEQQRCGSAWETRAADFLTGKGLAIIARGYRCRLGELDIIARDQASLIVVEVRARASTSSARASIGPGKQRRIINATRHYLMKNPEWHSRPIRFDVVAFEKIETSKPELHWIRHAFEAS